MHLCLLKHKKTLLSLFIFGISFYEIATKHLELSNNANSVTLDSGTTSLMIGPQSSTMAPVLCKSRWSTWINKDIPTSGDGDREVI